MRTAIIPVAALAAAALSHRATPPADAALVSSSRSAADALSATSVRIAAPSARYRVVITGFTVNRETWDNAFEMDGKRDEVFVHARLETLNRAASTVSEIGTMRTRVIGDVNGQAGRIRGGSASAQGGLRTGDSFPTAQPWTLAGSVTTDGLPLQVWSGELTAGGNAVGIVPSVWEWDGPQDFLQQWLDFGAKILPFGGPIVQAMVAEPAKALIKLYPLGVKFADVAYGGMLGTAADRQIGMDVVGTTSSGQPMYGWKDTPMVTLTFEGAESLLASNPTGRGPGILAVRFVDNAKFAGDYTLYLKLERLP